MSCNGCRVLRKGCSESCLLRPCLAAVEGADAQGHATIFLAKFFGRAGLMGFISAVDESQRPGSFIPIAFVSHSLYFIVGNLSIPSVSLWSTALFQSLLYEACGRTINPVYGSAGLLWTGQWHLCEAAVESVLKGGTPNSCFTNVHNTSSTLSQTSSRRQCNPSHPHAPPGLPPQAQAPVAPRAPQPTNHMTSNYPMAMVDPSAMPYWPVSMASMSNGVSHMAQLSGQGGYQAQFQAAACPVPVPNYLTNTNQFQCNSAGQMNSQQVWVPEAMMNQQQAAMASGRQYHKGYRNGLGGSNSPVSDGSCVLDSMSGGLQCSSPPLVAPVARRLTALQ